MRRLTAIHTAKPSVAMPGTCHGIRAYRVASLWKPFGVQVNTLESASEGTDGRPPGG